MKIAIIGAMRKEVENLLGLVKDINIVKTNNYEFYVGKLFGHELILSVGGIGKVSTGMICATLVNIFPGVEKIINIGVSGGIKGMVKPGTVVIGKFYSYADVDATAIDDVKYGTLPDMPRLYQGDNDILKLLKKSEDSKASNEVDGYVVGDILSGDSFYTDYKQVSQLIKNHFSDLLVCAVDMESTAFAQACYSLNIPFIAIRAISDVIGSDNQADDYYDYMEIACKKSTKILLEILEDLS